MLIQIKQAAVCDFGCFSVLENF